jgi:enoyl-CoA hydratase/carnithine racemase
VTDAHVTYAVDEGMALVTLARPEKRNAITTAMALRIRDICEDVNSNDAVRVMVITGAGDRAFCAGSDVASLDDFATPWRLRRRPAYTDYVRAVEKCVIAAVNGYAYGGGLELALSGDIRIASASASFAAPEVKLGWIGGGGMAALLTHSVGPSNAALMVCSGEPIDAHRALQWGLVSEVVAAERLLERSLELARTIASRPPIATQVAKLNLRAAHAMAVDDAIRYERDLQTLSFYTEDAAEGRRAFSEKRPGVFRGR